MPPFGFYPEGGTSQKGKRHMENLVEMKGMTKLFPAVRALSEIDLDLRPGEVHLLLGENGEKLESLTAVKGRDIIQAANGKESVLEFNLTQAQAKKLGQTENILLEVKASTTNNQEVVVAADAKLSFDLKLVAKAVITDLDDF